MTWKLHKQHTANQPTTLANTSVYQFHDNTTQRDYNNMPKYDYVNAACHTNAVLRYNKVTAPHNCNMPRKCSTTLPHYTNTTCHVNTSQQHFSTIQRNIHRKCKNSKIEAPLRHYLPHKSIRHNNVTSLLKRNINTKQL